MPYSDITVFVGLEEPDLLELKSSAITAIKANLGRIESSVSAPGISATYLITMSPQDVLRAANYALSQLDPITYGVFVRRTQGVCL
jgi:hypothetical protein